MNGPVVVLGGTGFVGRRLVATLVGRGLRVRVPSRNPNLHRDLRLLPGVEVPGVDPYSTAGLDAAFAGAGAVVNLIGILNERGYSGKGFQKAHVDLTRDVIAASRRAGVQRLVQMSALRAGEGESHYLRTRGEAETLVRQSGLAWTIVRPSVVFGRGDGLYTRFARLLRLLPMLPLARAQAKFAPVFVDDVAEAITRCLLQPPTAGETFELFGPEVMSLRRIVEDTARWTGRRRWIIGLPDALGWLQAQFGDLLPGKPISSDNFRSLKLDSVGTRDGLAVLGIVPTPVAAIVPDLLAGGRHQSRLDRCRGDTLR
ncbi:complex I NDUFA9 subunit family protein [Pseudofulvimonas gallinarii]|jgi:uncharacterized protein YbjT (DUF2867 family)|uniref:NADH dehydrogenase n=1 Tax=Pseudofulvimonas gallinarii TaxID=634155 RepID=A0A4S3L0A0_9GAMM|nr:complex I NDUFA9 subunit family protein [Pseudofulvimonas gallinarii]TCS98876.1 NADH dehydrogenase [Pseudofulvimonas gallinarii]THD14358.1 hypothetical protein B1808_03595 [Pseudofulvimonas gallinarii]